MEIANQYTLLDYMKEVDRRLLLVEEWSKFAKHFALNIEHPEGAIKHFERERIQTEQTIEMLKQHLASQTMIANAALREVNRLKREDYDSSANYER